MLYFLVRPLARLVFKFWFTKIHLVHSDRVPLSDPVIMAINHPTIFIEPCLMACYQPRGLFFLAKGVLFVRPFVGLLKSLHLIPLYRQKDGGFGKRKGNVDTFAYCYKKFDQNGAILIMPEGSSAQIRHLRPLTKGFAKMAFGAYQKNKDTRLKILPVGVNFSNPDQLRSQVSLGFGKPLAIRDYIELYEKNPRIATNQLTDDLYAGMIEQIVHVEDKQDFVLVDQILNLVENNVPINTFTVVVKNSEKIAIHKKATEKIGGLNTIQKETLQKKTTDYFGALSKAGLSDYALMHADKYRLPGLLVLIFTHPIFLFGWLTNVLPYGFGLLCGSKARDVETRMSVVLGMTFGFYLFYYPLMMWLACRFGGWMGFVVALLIPVFGYFSVLYLDVVRRYRGAIKVRHTDSSQIGLLRKLRKEIMEST